MSIGLGAAAGAADSVGCAGTAPGEKKISVCSLKICLGLEEPPGGSDIKSRSEHSKEKGATNLGGYVGGYPAQTRQQASLLAYKRLMQFCCRREAEQVYKRAAYRRPFKDKSAPCEGA